MRPATPWTYQFHWLSWAAVGAVAVGYALIVRRPAWPATRRQRAAFLSGLALLAVALTWPLEDLAVHWSLLALVLQRLLLLLAVPPLLLVGTPGRALAALTRPALVDDAVRICSRPAVAVGIVTVVAVGTLTSGAVVAAASSPVARVALDAVLLGAGFVLWAPALNVVPGAHRMSALGRAAYLIVQSIVPSFLSIVWIFARHPLYPGFDRRLVGMSPLLDQRLAGFAAKFGTIALLWTVAFVIVNRSHELSGQATDEVPLTWSDVEREFERAERRQGRRPASAGLEGAGGVPGTPARDEADGAGHQGPDADGAGHAAGGDPPPG